MMKEITASNKFDEKYRRILLNIIKYEKYKNHSWRQCLMKYNSKNIIILFSHCAIDLKKNQKSSIYNCFLMHLYML